ncbi:MAG: dTMP kinase [Ignavibacteria bacterium]|jgi:dTMP kinase|nr:dTMP kinase [Ignavibacteria bacterium]
MFISFEGIDFCGKSTQIKLLQKHFEDKKFEVRIIREPGGTEISEQIRTILLSKKNNLMTLETEILLFSSSRAQLVREKLRPYLDKGYYVISDRFHDSTTAYQGYGRGIPLETVKHIHEISIGNTIPELTFFIDIPVAEAERRMGLISSNELDRIEVSKKTFFEDVRKGYLEIARNEERFRVLNGLNSIEEIHEEILKEIDNYEKGK